MFLPSKSSRSFRAERVWDSGYASITMDKYIGVQVGEIQERKYKVSRFDGPSINWLLHQSIHLCGCSGNTFAQFFSHLTWMKWSMRISRSSPVLIDLQRGRSPPLHFQIPQ